MYDRTIDTGGNMKRLAALGAVAIVAGCAHAQHPVAHRQLAQASTPDYSYETCPERVARLSIGWKDRAPSSAEIQADIDALQEIGVSASGILHFDEAATGLTAGSTVVKRVCG